MAVDRPGDAEEVCTVALADRDGKTEMAFRQVGGNLSPEEYEMAGRG
jgi:hypothetical protein